ncbi:TadE/TadG family type IV pilus assembly protein [Celeribacter sp. PS-C1]|uniref:TadE/TadG family type IV pilus assembly protein n=1 Tax=Celeribacter sp. PS-C1 TaxID=2820813 RepID=UPI001C686809
MRQRFWRNEEGAILVETLVAMPVLALITFGILEFGNLMWQRQQLQIGVRDAARYWSKCRHTVSPTAFDNCDATIARNIAFHGRPDGSGPFRVPGWDEASELTLWPAEDGLNPTPGLGDYVQVEGRFEYQGSPFFNAVFCPRRDDICVPIEIGYWATMRYYGW